MYLELIASRPLSGLVEVECDVGRIKRPVADALPSTVPQQDPISFHNSALTGDCQSRRCAPGKVSNKDQAEQEEQQGEFYDAGLNTNIQNSRYQEKVSTTHHALRRD